MAIIFSALVLSLLATLAWTQDDGNPHQQASTCILQYRSGCDSVCLVCHTPSSSAPVAYPTPWNSGGVPITEVYSDPEAAAERSSAVADLVDDVSLCIGCHTAMGGPRDHPVGIEYQSLTKALVAAPQGPKLLCVKDGGACKLQCSTCHNPHSSEADLLRVNNQGSALCISCHNK